MYELVQAFTYKTGSKIEVCQSSEVNHPAGTWCQNDVGSTSMRRHDVASTLIRRHFGTKCPLGMYQHFLKALGRSPQNWISLTHLIENRYIIVFPRSALHLSFQNLAVFQTSTTKASINSKPHATNSVAVTCSPYQLLKSLL